MSVKELKLVTATTDLEITTELDCFKIIAGEEVIFLDRSQAHLLMLYLQEHLK